VTSAEYRDRDFEMTKSLDIRNVDFAICISQCNLGRQIKVKSEPLIPVNGEVSGIGTLK
jgi:hypothetical protein